MPPKVTIAYGKNFHFFREAHESTYVYLELEDVPFEAGYRRVMIAIPVDVWRTLRGLAAVDLDLINASDAELIELVETKRSDNRLHKRPAFYWRIYRAFLPSRC